MARSKTNQDPLAGVEPEDLLELAEKAGWGVKELTGTRGWQIFPRDKEQSPVRVPPKFSHRGRENVVAQCRTAGLDRDLLLAQDARETDRKTRLAAGQQVRPAANNGSLTQQIGTLAHLLGPLSAHHSDPPPAVFSNAPTHTPASAPRKDPVSTTPPPDMYFEMVDVTPGQAQKWLDRELPLRSNGQRLRQRALDEARAMTYAQTMEDGEWRPTSPEAVALAPEAPHNTGGVVDGQHRLWAVVASGVTQRMWVAFNVDPDHFDVIDIGKPRTAPNILQIAGESDTSRLSSAIRLAYAYLQYEQGVPGSGDWTSWTRMGLRPHQQLEFLEEHPTLRDQVRPGGVMMTKPHGNVSAGIVFRWLVLRAWPGANDAAPLPYSATTPPPDGVGRLDHFCELIRSGTGWGWGPYHPCHTLREWLISGNGVVIGSHRRAQQIRRETQLVALLTAWRAYCLRQITRAVRITAGQAIPAPWVPKEERPTTPRKSTKQPPAEGGQ